jgi:hypothetical protein
MTVGLILVLSLPFLLFAFVTTLFNHIEVSAMDIGDTTETVGGSLPNQKPVEVTS